MGTIGRQFGRLLCAALVLSCDASLAAEVPSKEVVRYVIDQHDGTPISGAIVVATWRSVGSHGWQACVRAESYISDADGSFKTPQDSRGAVILGAYKKGYERGNSPKDIVMASDGDHRHAQVAHLRWNNDNSKAEIVSIEPKIFSDRQSATEASRAQIDAFLRKSHKDRLGRLQELHRMRGEASCLGATISTAGAAPFYRALYEEQLELNDAQVDLDITLRYESAAKERAGAR